jgi:hypothetical protein
VHIGQRSGERLSRHLGTPAGEVAEVVDDSRKVTLPGVLKWLAVVEALQLRKLFGVLLD